MLHKATKIKSKPKRDQKASKGKKKGNPGVFIGLQLEYLEQYAEEYCRLAGKKSQMRSFWAKFFPGYWQRFPWHLSTEPVEFALSKDKTGE